MQGDSRTSHAPPLPPVAVDYALKLQRLAVKNLVSRLVEFVEDFSLKFLAATLLEVEGRKSAKFFIKFSPQVSPMLAEHFAGIFALGGYRRNC